MSNPPLTEQTCDEQNRPKKIASDRWNREWLVCALRVEVVSSHTGYAKSRRPFWSGSHSHLRSPHESTRGHLLGVFEAISTLFSPRAARDI